MPPKKEKAQKLSLNEFMNDGSFGGGNWADEVEETYASGTQPLPATDRQRSTYTSSYSRGDASGGFGGGDRFAGYARQEREELPIPDKPPYTAHLGNLSYDANQEAVTEFFSGAGCEVVSVRIVEDRAEMRPKGFGYAEFATPDDLKKALTLNEESFFNRNIRIRVADPPKDRYGNDSNRDFSDWTRKGPLPDAPGRSNNRGPREFTEAREPREFREPRAAGPDYSQMSWERKGPLSPVAPPPMERGGSRTGSRSGHRMTERTNSYANRGASPAAWGPGEGRQEPRPDSRPPREPRAPTAAEQEFDWRSKMRPDAPASKSPVPSRAGSEAPPSPALAPAAPAAPAGRPKLNLQKRTISEAPGVMSPSLTSSESKASPFGAARPIDTAAREREIEEKKQRELQEKKEAEEKAKEEKRLAKEAAAKEASEKAAAEVAEAAAESDAPTPADAPAAETTEATEATTKDVETTGAAAQNGVNGSEQKIPVRPRESADDRAPFKSRANDSGNWRSSGAPRGVPAGPRGDRRGGGASRGGRSFEGRQPSRRGNEQRRGSDQQPSTPTTPVVDADGWTTVSTSAKGRRGRPVPS